MRLARSCRSATPSSASRSTSYGSRCRYWRTSVEVTELREAATKLSADVAMTPPTSLEADVMAAIGHVRQVSPPAPEDTAGATVTVLQPRRFTRRSALAVAAAGLAATVIASNRKDAAVVVLQDLRQLPADQIYQLWLIDSSKTAPSIGLTTGQKSRDQTKVVAGGVTGKVASGLTVEPAGGSAKPTMPAAAIIAMA